MLPMPQSTAERQKAFKDGMKAAGYVKLEAYVTREQREKFRALGGDAWLRKKIDGSGVSAKTAAPAKKSGQSG